MIVSNDVLSAMKSAWSTFLRSGDVDSLVWLGEAPVGSGDVIARHNAEITRAPYLGVGDSVRDYAGSVESAFFALQGVQSFSWLSELSRDWAEHIENQVFDNVRFREMVVNKAVESSSFDMGGYLCVRVLGSFRRIA